MASSVASAANTCGFFRLLPKCAATRPTRPNCKPEKKHVAIVDIQPVGNYAVKLVFDDGHDSGLYSWDYLYQLGRNQQANWQDYLAQLARAGASRE
jgi:DUF971 family protein